MIIKSSSRDRSDVGSLLVHESEQAHAHVLRPTFTLGLGMDIV